MDFHAIQGDRTTHVMTTHRTEADETPLQLVSAAKVAHWQRVEKEHAEMRELHPEITPVKKAGD